jgi:predicted unusual protein kinase regulating ubiquinone biosynthesis (AarF/ABC1/UbiB family)
MLASYAFAGFMALSEREPSHVWARAHAANARRFADGCAELGGVFIKLGQVLGVVGTFLPNDYSRELERLQDQVPPRPFEGIRARLEEAFGPSALERFGSFEEVPLASASLAQVHRATTRDGRAVAVKVLHPGIEHTMRGDLRLIRALLPLVRGLLPLTHVERVLDELGRMVEREADFAAERANLERLRKALDGRAQVALPEVIPELTSAGVLTLTFEEGIKISDVEALGAAGIDTQSVAKLLVQTYLHLLLEKRVFHADPHPGNLFVRPGPELVIVDFGAVEEVTDRLATGMRQALSGLMLRDDDAVLRGLEHMGFVAPHGDRPLLARVGREYMRILGSRDMRNLGAIDRELIQSLYDHVRGQLREVMHGIEYPDGFFYVERTLVLLFGVVSRLAPSQGLAGLALPLAATVFARGARPLSVASVASAPPTDRTASSDAVKP